MSEPRQNLDLTQGTLAEGLMLEGRNLLDRHALASFVVLGSSETRSRQQGNITE